VAIAVTTAPTKGHSRYSSPTQVECSVYEDLELKSDGVPHGEHPHTSLGTVVEHHLADTRKRRKVSRSLLQVVEGE
jgi:hypothetical protein